MASPRFKSPVRVSITLPWITSEQLIRQSQAQGRSVSNLAAYLIESSLSTLSSSAQASASPVPMGVRSMNAERA
jgi:hypothetical protein